MNSIFNCFHAGVNFVSACLGTSTRLPTTMDFDQEEAQVPLGTQDQQGDTTTTTNRSNLLMQDHSLQESMHEGKHDKQPDLSELNEQPTITNRIPPTSVSIPTSNCPHTQDLAQHTESVAHRTRSRLLKNRDLQGPLPVVRSTTNKRPKNVYKFQRRATQRWCKLLTASKSRLAKNGLKDALGPHWPAFVRYAKDKYWKQWEKLFSSTMKCNGPLKKGGCCPFKLCAEPTCEQDLSLVQLLHLDHAYPLHSICRAWLSIIKSQPAPLTSWDQGIDGDMVCQLLFGVESHTNLHTTGNELWRANVRFRCYFNDGQGCHDVHGYANAHLTIRTTDIAR